MGWLLALDGATEELTLALVSAEGEVFAHAEAGGASASSRLLPALQSLMAAHQLSSSSVDALAFGRGPGAFTSLRAICACVQGLAWGWGKPVLALDSLLLPAEAALGQATAGELDVAVAMDARMGEIYAARYRRENQQWRCTEEPGLWTPEDLREAWRSPREPSHWLGSGLPMLGLGTQAPGGTGLMRAQALGRMAIQAWRRGECMDAAQAQPLYVRDKVALTSAERAGRALTRSGGQVQGRNVA